MKPKKYGDFPLMGNEVFFPCSKILAIHLVSAMLLFLLEMIAKTIDCVDVLRGINSPMLAHFV